MRRPLKIFLAALALITATLPAHAEWADSVSNVESLTIVASNSVTVPLAEISKQYSRRQNIDVNTVYDASGELARRIEDGDPADVVVTPSKAIFESMKSQGLLDMRSITTIAGNRLHLVTSKSMKIEKSDDIKANFQQIFNKTLMVIGDPDTTALGHGTKAALKKIGLWSLFEKRVVLAPTSTKAMDLIIKGESAGVVYATDAQLYRNYINDFGELPEDSYEPVQYYAAVVVGGNMIKARQYLSFLESKPAKEIWRRNGFIVK